MKKIILCTVITWFSTFAYSQSISSEPDWSPDGTAFVYTQGEDNIHLYIYSLKDQSSTRLTDTKGADLNPAWSPSGRYIAFVSTRNGNRDLYYYDLTTKKTTQLTASPEMEATPSWWGEDKLTFVRFDPTDKSRKIYKVKMGGDAREYTPEVSMEVIYPKLSPTNNTLVFGAKPKGSEQSFHLYAKDLTEGTLTQLEDLPIVSYNPSWFPSGRAVAFINQGSQDVTSAAIYTYDFDKNSTIKTLSCERGCYHPRVSPDGQHILYLDGWGKASKGIYLLDLTTKDSEKLR